MYAGIIQGLAVVLFGVCLYDSWRREGPKYSQQWFAVGYYFGILREALLVQLSAIAYPAEMVLFGSAPSLTTLLFPCYFYIAYLISRRLNPTEDTRRMVLSVALLTPALALPIEATAVQLGWWSYPAESPEFWGGVPYYVPFAWALTGALFYSLISCVRRIRLRGNGQFFALILGAPLLAGLEVLSIAILQIVVGWLNLVPGNLLLNLLLALVLFGLPLAFLLPRHRQTPQFRDHRL